MRLKRRIYLLSRARVGSFTISVFIVRIHLLLLDFVRIIRKILKLAVMAAIVGALASWFRSRSTEETEGEDEDLPWLHRLFK